MTSTKKDISIIVPIYNAEKYIKKCVNSLINQTKKEIEIILVNDGSTDQTEKIIKTFQDSRIRYFKNKNQGIGKTRNFGIQKAEGEYLLFVDSDDTLEKTACEVLYKKAKKDHLDVVVCDFFIEHDDGTLEEEILPSFENTSLKDNPKLLNSINLSPWNKIYRKDLLIKNKISFVEDLKYEDALFIADILAKAEKIGKVDKCLNYYLVHENSETTVRDKRCFDILEIIKRMRLILKDECLQEELNKLTVRMLTNYTIQQRVQKDKKVAMKFIDEAFAYMKKEIPDYKNNKYYVDRGLIKRTIEKNKFLTKQYCLIYKFLKK